MSAKLSLLLLDKPWSCVLHFIQIHTYKFIEIVITLKYLSTQSYTIIRVSACFVQIERKRYTDTIEKKNNHLQYNSHASNEKICVLFLPIYKCIIHVLIRPGVIYSSQGFWQLILFAKHIREIKLYLIIDNMPSKLCVLHRTLCRMCDYGHNYP